jgi:hypothetical protein
MAGRRPRGFWRDMIRDAYRALGGSGRSTDVYAWVSAHVNLTARETSGSPHQGRPYLHHTIRGIISDMAADGELVHVEDGYYTLAAQ